jgi:hypothetical protein
MFSLLYFFDHFLQKDYPANDLHIIPFHISKFQVHPLIFLFLDRKYQSCLFVSYNIMFPIISEQITGTCIAPASRRHWENLLYEKHEPAHLPKAYNALHDQSIQSVQFLDDH